LLNKDLKDFDLIEKDFGDKENTQKLIVSLRELQRVKDFIETVELFRGIHWQAI
jgi:hypothetical protein